MDGSLAPSILTGNVVGVAILLFSWGLVLPKGRSSEFFLLALGNTLWQLGVWAYLTEHWILPALSVIVSNGLMLTGILLITRSLESLAGWSRWRRIEVVFLLICLGLMGLFSSPFLDHLAMRTTAFSAMTLLCLFRMLDVVFRGLPEDRQEQPVLLAAFGFLLGLLALIMVIRITQSWVIASEAGVEESATLSYLGSLVAQMTLSFGFVSLVHRRDQRLLENTLSTRDRLLGLIAHDLRGPTGAVAHVLEMLRDGEVPPEEQAEFFRTGAESARRNTELLENLLDWALTRQKEYDLRPRSMTWAELLADVEAPLNATARAKQITVVQSIPQSLVLFADPRTAAALLRNLLSNALKFTPAGGSIQIEAWQEEAGTSCRITDSGPGLPSGALERLNQGEDLISTLGSAGETGSGLGLSLCRDFLRANRGSWKFDSHPQGTTVTVTFPSSKEQWSQRTR